MVLWAKRGTSDYQSLVLLDKFYEWRVKAVTVENDLLHWIAGDWVDWLLILVLLWDENSLEII
jgi:hypothetical protein